MSAYAKALFAAVGGFLGAWLLGLDDDRMTQKEWVYAVSQAVALGGGVWALPNRAPKTRRRRPDMSEQAAEA